MNAYTYKYVQSILSYLYHERAKFEFIGRTIGKSPMALSVCLARLTNWDKTSFRIDSCFTVSQVVLCKRVVSSGVLCDECLKRPTEGKYHSRIIHGLLTDPIPITSSIYGGPVYWAKMKKFQDAGKELSVEAKEWIAKAAAAQDAAEKLAPGIWKVQRLSDKDIERMAKAKAAKLLIAKTAPPQKETSIKTMFTPVEVRFRETDKPPVRLETDTMAIRQQVVDGKTIWIAENGMRFEDVKGEIGEPLAS